MPLLPQQSSEEGTVSTSILIAQVTGAQRDDTTFPLSQLPVMGSGSEAKAASLPHWTQLQVMLTASHPSARCLRLALIFLPYTLLYTHSFIQLFDRGAKLSSLIFIKWFLPLSFLRRGLIIRGQRKRWIFNTGGWTYENGQVIGACLANQAPLNIYVLSPGTCAYVTLHGQEPF